MSYTSSPGSQEMLIASSLAYADSFDVGMYSNILDRATQSVAAMNEWSVITVSNKTLFNASGMKAVVFQAGSGSIVISYMGTTASWSQLWADVQLAVGSTPKAFSEAKAFAESIAQQYPDNKIYVTGHSLGGSEAEYVSSQLGYGGIEFAGTGIGGFDNTEASRTSIIDYAVKGDPVANYSTDSGYAIPWLLASDMDHVGTFSEIGSRWDAAALYTAYWSMNPISIGYCVTLHPLSNYAKELSLTYLDSADLIKQAAANPAALLAMSAVPDSALLSQFNSDFINPVAVLTLLEECAGKVGRKDLHKANVINENRVETPMFVVDTGSNGDISNIDIKLKHNIIAQHANKQGSNLIHAFTYEAEIDNATDTVMVSTIAGKYGDSVYVSAVTQYGALHSIDLSGQEFVTIDAVEDYKGQIAGFTSGKAIILGGAQISTAEIDSNGDLLITTDQGEFVIDLITPIKAMEASNLTWSSDGQDGAIISFARETTQVFHSPGSSTVVGTDGSDRLSGSTGGTDVIIGGKGADVMKGSFGPDTFVFRLGDSGQSQGYDIIRDFTKGPYGAGDIISYVDDLVDPASFSDVVSEKVSILADTGVATIYNQGSKASMQSNLAAIADFFTSSGDQAGQFAFFKSNGAQSYTLFISDGVSGVTPNDVVVQLTGIKDIGSIDLFQNTLGVLT